MLSLALKHLLSRRRQTALTLAGILLGTTAFVTISGLMLGFRIFIIRQLVDNDCHVRVSAREEFLTERSLDEFFFGEAAHVFWAVPPAGRKDEARIDYPQGWFDRLDAHPSVLAYSQQLTAQALVRKAKTVATARLVGVRPGPQAAVTTIETYMVEGRFSDLREAGNQLIVGEGLLKKLGARLTETVQVTAGRGPRTPFKIVGVFRFGVQEIDDALAYGALSDVQRANGTPSELTDIAVRLADFNEAAETATTWAQTSREKVRSWDQTHANILAVFRMQDIVRFSMTTAILVVAGFGIYNVLAMMVQHKRREIAILRSMGFEGHDILTLFLVQGLILGTLGGLIGLVLGYGVTSWFSTVQIYKEGEHMLGGGKMLVAFEPATYVQGFLLALVSSAVAGFLPARAAGRMRPIDIIRSEGG